MKIHHALLLLAGGLAAGLALPVPQAQSADSAAHPANAKPGKSPRSMRMPEVVRREIRAIRSVKDRHARMQAVVRLAASLPVADLKEWYEGNYLGFLDKDTGDLFRLIAEERWMEADPADIARFMMDRKEHRAERYIEAWLKADQAAAISYLDTRHGEQRDELIEMYAEILGKTDMPRALEFLSATETRNRFVAQAALNDLAKLDRDAVVAYVDGWPKEDRSRALIQFAEARLGTDLRWAIALLQQQGETAESFSRNMRFDISNLYAVTSKLALFARLPAGWAEQIARSDNPDALTNTCPVEWLELRERPAWLSQEAFEKFQLAAATDSNSDFTEQPTAARRLVEQGDWLPTELRAKLAAKLVRNWKDGVDQAEAWVATLDEDLRAETTQALDVLREISQTQALEWLANGQPSEYLRALLDKSSRAGRSGASESWTSSEIAEAISATGNFSQEECGKLLSKSSFPPKLSASLLQRAGDTLPPERSINLHASVAADWAEEDASAAAKWVESLPEGESRTWAAKNVVLRWSSYSPAAAKAWEVKMAAKP